MEAWDGGAPRVVADYAEAFGLRVCMYARMREEVRTRRQAHIPYLCVVSGFRRDVNPLAPELFFFNFSTYCI